MKLNLKSNENKKHEKLLTRAINERLSLGEGEELSIELIIDQKLDKEESYKIEAVDGTWHIVGSDNLGLYYGIGKFLRTAKWHKDSFEPSATNGVIAPDCPFRATYFSVHFHNWYHEAPVEELIRYTEDVLLSGYNTIFCIFPIVNMSNFEDETYHMFREKTRTVYKIAKDLGMKIGTIINPNQGLKTTPERFAADPSCYEGRTGGGGKNICPEIDGALEYLRGLWQKVFEQYTDIGLDYIMTFPYDEGGCGCEKCMPWGAKGFPTLSKKLYEDALPYYPNAKFILSTWYFDEKYTEPWELGEYKGLYERLKGDMSYVDMLMCDSHNDFPRYPLEHEVIRPIINFPEISMYGMRSWGGRGANPLPSRFQRIWESSKKVLSGGMPYSEGLYEDILKFQCSGYYWNKEAHYNNILAEYISYEYSDKTVDEVIEMMELIELNHVGVREDREPDMEAARRAEELARAVDKKLPARAKKAWRWRILYIRAVLDNVIYTYHTEKCQGKEKALYEVWNTREYFFYDNDEAQALLQELCHYYHTIDKEKCKNHWTFPPVKDGKVQKN